MAAKTGKPPLKLFKSPAEKPVSLQPLKVEEALGDLLKVRPSTDRERKRGKVKRNKGRIAARFTIEEHAVVLTVELQMVGFPKFKEDYTLPQIKHGNTADALETLARLTQQGRVDSDTEQRLGELIKAFGRLTE